MSYGHGLIGNCTSAALVSSDCGVEWLCLPFFDSPSIFADILDREKGGSMRIEGLKTKKISQKYVPRTAILKTTFITEDGEFEVNDYMPRFITGPDRFYCPSEVQRNIRVISGRPRIIVRLKAMPNYALEEARYTVNQDHIKITSQKGEYNSYFLYSNLDLNKVLAAEPIEISDFCFLLLSYHEKLDEVNNNRIYLEYEKTKSYWLDWAERTNSPRGFREDVIRSAITLKLLTFQRTGAVIAAPTTSLPEIIGQTRNWDYRFCWIRDASMTIELYSRIGHIESGTRFLNFILNRIRRKTENIAVMYSISGEKQLKETTLDHLSGYEGSRPVRIGNEAYIQSQNDLYGELMEAIYTYLVINRERDHQLLEEIWTIVRTLVNQVRESWEKPDSGIWERRKSLQHYVHSKVMNWVAMDRAVKIAKCFNKSVYVRRWSELAGRIKNEILQRGWNERLGSFSMFYGGDAYDASNLLMLHYGFLDKSDPMMVSTVRKSCENLVRNGLTFRYLSEDEFGQPRNAFVVTSFWMINALHLTGEKERAKEMLKKLSSLRNPLGLFSEAIDVDTGRLTGNFPQGYSHLAHIQTLFLLETDYDWSDVNRTMVCF